MPADGAMVRSLFEFNLKGAGRFEPVVNGSFALTSV